MASIILSDLRARVREAADMPTTGFVTDTANSLDAWINEGVQQLHGKMVDAMGEEYASKSSTFTTVADQSDYTLPTDFFKLYGVDLSASSGGPTRTLTPFNRSERGAYNDSLLALQPIPRYQLVQDTLRLYPKPGAGQTGTIYYAPEATLLVLPGDTVKIPNGWEAWVVCYAAIRALAKEESSIGDLRVIMKDIERQIEDTKEQRDLANAHQSVDMDLVDFDRIFRWRI